MSNARRPHRARRTALRAAGGEGDTSTETMLSRVARGEEEAFAVLYDRCTAQVYGLVRRILRDPGQSEEVAQEVLLEVWRTAPRFDPDKGSALTWIMTLAHRRAVDRVRSEQAARRRDDVAGRGEEWLSRFDVVSEEVEVLLEHQQVRKALDQLTDLQREAVTLAYYGGYTYRQVAEVLGAPEGTVKTRLRDGLIRLRDELGVVT